MSERSKELIRNTIIIAFGKICTYFSTFLLIPLLTSRLSTSDYGLVDLILSYVVLLAPNLAIQQELAVFRFLVDCRGDNKKTKLVISSSTKIVTRTAIIAFIITILVLTLVKSQYSMLVALNVISVMLSGYFLQIARGLGKNSIFSAGSAVIGVLNIILCAIGLIWLELGVSGVLCASIISNCIGAIYLVIILKLYRSINFSLAKKEEERKLIKYSAPLIPNSLSWWAINTSDRTIVSVAISVSANGIYAVANKFPSIITSLYSILGLSLMESASLHINDRDRDEYFSSILNNTFRLFSCICIGLLASMPFLFSFLVDRNYNEAYLYVPAIVVGSFLNCIVGTYSSIFFAKKMTKKIMNTSIVSALINIIVDLCLIKFIGIYAAAASTIVAYLSMILYRHIELKKEMNIRLDLRLVIISLLMFLLVCCLYYVNSFWINMISLGIVIIYSCILNRAFLKKILKTRSKNAIK